ncbi:MAG: hypothetical protein VXU50_03000 [Verrucomicrobiota bacterium]|nr:hypothetical protein [Verrucomicrobiota bacterium]
MLINDITKRSLQQVGRQGANDASSLVAATDTSGTAKQWPARPQTTPARTTPTRAAEDGAEQGQRTGGAVGGDGAAPETMTDAIMAAILANAADDEAKHLMLSRISGLVKEAGISSLVENKDYAIIYPSDKVI